MMGIDFIKGDAAIFSQFSAPNKNSPPPSKPRSEPADKIEAAFVLADFSAKVNGYASTEAFSRGNLQSIASRSHYSGLLEKDVEVPRNVRDAAITLLKDDEAFNIIDHNDDNLLATEELQAFAETNSTLANMFPV